MGYSGIALLLASLPIWLAQRCGASRRMLALSLPIVIAAMLLPWNGQSLVYYVRGVVGDLSVSSLVLLGILYARTFFVPVKEQQPIRCQIGWVLLAIQVPLYASTLGYWSYDLYGWGYEPHWMLPMVGALMLWAWCTQPALGLAWLAGVISFALGMTLSRNLWDALFDPFMLFAGIGIAASSMLQAVLRKKSATPMAEAAELRLAA